MRKSLTKIARPSGALAMVAVDQREALRGMFAAHQSTPVPDSQLTQFKVDVARQLSPFASALLVDQEFGIDAIIEQKALQGSCGLIAAADLLVGPPGGAATDTAVDPEIDPIRMRDIGSVGLKFLILWRNDESPDTRAQLVEDFNKLCTVSGLPSIIEIIVKPPTDSSRSFNREEELISAAKEAAAWKPDLYKAEVPFHGEGDLSAITKHAERISEAIGSPWVVLSNGVKQPFLMMRSKHVQWEVQAVSLLDVQCGQTLLGPPIFQRRYAMSLFHVYSSLQRLLIPTPSLGLVGN